MDVQIKDIEKLLKELSVTVPAETVNPKMEEKFEEVRNKVTLKGYRKGKAPMDMIKSLYEDQVKADVAEDIFKTTYSKIIKEKTLKVASYPSVTGLNFADDGSLNYIARVEVFPEIEKVNFDNLEIATYEISTEDEEVDEVMEHIRKRFSELRPVEREARDGDVVIVDIEKVDDPNNILANDKFPDSEVDLGNKLTVKEFTKELTGMKVGEEKEIEVVYDNDYPDKVFAGARLKYKCHIKTIKERIMPPMNDAFAKQTGDAETVLELRMKIRERLKQQKTEEQNRDQKNQIINHICEKNPVPIPKSLVNNYLTNVIEDFKKQYKDIDEVEIRKNYEPIGENTIRWNMLMYQLAKQENIEVLPSDMDNLINKFAENYKMTPQQARENIQKSGNMADLRESLLEEKIIDFLMSKAKLNKADN
ncbi:MAG: trigger factor [FCB group bacterium]|nr:trigger factor [FCB group bacterium]